MIANMQAIYIGNRAGTFKGENEKDINFCTIALGNPDDNHSDQVMLCSKADKVDLSNLKRFESYNFIIDIPIVLKDKQKVKIVGVIPFETIKPKAEK